MPLHTGGTNRVCESLPADPALEDSILVGCRPGWSPAVRSLGLSRASNLGCQQLLLARWDCGVRRCTAV